VTQGIAPSIRSVLALSILLCLILLGWGLVVSPLIEMPRDRQAGIAALADELDRLRTIAALRPELARRAASLQAQFAAEGGLWAGASTAAIAARVQDRLRQVVSSSGGRVKSTSEAKEGTASTFRQVTIRFSIEGTLDTVQKTFAAIEASRPALFVDGLTIVAPMNAMARDKPPTLNLDLDVTGYMAAPRS
jgi:hypothetical protein